MSSHLMKWKWANVVEIGSFSIRGDNKVISTSRLLTWTGRTRSSGREDCKIMVKGRTLATRYWGLGFESCCVVVFFLLFLFPTFQHHLIVECPKSSPSKRCAFPCKKMIKLKKYLVGLPEAKQGVQQKRLQEHESRVTFVWLAILVPCIRALHWK